MGESQRSCNRNVREIFLFLVFLCWVSIPDVDFISTSSSKQHVEQYIRTGDLRKLIWFRWLCICYWYNPWSFSAFDRKGGGSNRCRWCKGSPSDVAFRERTIIQVVPEEMAVYWLSFSPYSPSPVWLLLLGWWYAKVCYLDVVDDVDGYDAQVAPALDVMSTRRSMLFVLCKVFHRRSPKFFCWTC